MKIKQGYVSSVVKGFDFLEKHNLKNYDNPNEPMVIFGCYNKVDYDIVNNHKSTVVIRWCGGDSLDVVNPSFFQRDNFIHLTPLINVHAVLNKKGINCHLKKICTARKPQPLILGSRVYSYLNKHKPNYYGKLLVDQIKDKYDFIIGDLSISQKDWRAGACEQFYSQAFIGLALSTHAGGAGGVVEMGLRGIKVVTNVVNLPNVIPWNNLEDVENAIIKEKENIGKVNYTLAHEVYNSMIHDMEFFDLDKILNE